MLMGCPKIITTVDAILFSPIVNNQSLLMLAKYEGYFLANFCQQNIIYKS
jgi:hypothetical protein